jgi:hypothetical protein
MFPVRAMMQVEIAGRLRRAGGQAQLKYMTHVRPMCSSLLDHLPDMNGLMEYPIDKYML